MRASSFNDKPTSKKGLLSMKAQLLKTRRDSVDAASIAAQKLDAAQRRLKAASDSHEALTSEHAYALRQSANALSTLAVAHLDHGAYEAIRDLRLSSVTPARTALISRCACVLLAAASPPPPAESSGVATSAAPAAAAAAGDEFASLSSIKTAKALVHLGDDKVASLLGRKDLNRLLASCRLERLIKSPEVVSFIAKTGGDFATAVVGAGRAPGLAAEMSAAKASKKKIGAAAALFKRVKAANRVAKLARRAGGGGGGGGEATVFKRSSNVTLGRRATEPVSSGRVAGVESALEQQMLAEAASGQMSLDSATASTAAAGHIFLWIAHVLDAACQLCEMELRAKGPIDAAASELKAAEAAFAQCKAEADRLKQEERAAIEAQERHAAVRRLQERAAAAAEVTPAVSESPTNSNSERGSNADSVHSFHSETEEDDEASSQGDAKHSSTPPAERRARQLAAFRQAEAQRENALRRQIIADGGEFMKS